jgi:hypothetical protein
MKRLVLISAGVIGAAGAGAAQQAQLQVQFQQVQIQPGYPVQPVPTKPAEKTEFKPAEGSTADPKSLDVSEKDSIKARDLVRQLNSSSYKERETATRDIAKMGRFAVPALKDALATESSPEVRLRIDIVMPKAEAEDMQARVSCFLLDSEGKFQHELPGWTKFKALLGSDKSTRELFAEVLKNKTYHSLLLACDLPANELGSVLISHYQAMQNAMNGGFNGRGRGGAINVQPTTPEIAVLAFLESIYPDKEMVLTNNWNYTSVASYLYNGDIGAAMIPGRGTGKYAVVLKKILTRWLDSRESGIGAQQAMQFAQQWQMTGDIPKYAARVLVADTQNGNWWVKVNALTTLGQHKDAKNYVAQIAKVFEDASLIQQNFPGQPGSQATIHLGDFALGVAIKLTGQAPKDYGLEVVNAQDYARWQQNNYYFKDEKDNKAEDKRKAAIKKFNEWLAKQPKEAIKKEEPKKDEPKKEEPKELKDAPVNPVPDLPVPLPAVKPKG